eukprot:scaffold16735_cov121-Skeletonema_marinoi.AAC.3
MDGSIGSELTEIESYKESIGKIVIKRTMHPPISSHQRSYVPNPILLVVAVEDDDDDVLVAVFGSYRRRYNVAGDLMRPNLGRLPALLYHHIVSHAVNMAINCF